MLHPISKLLNIQRVLSWANDSGMVFHLAGRVNTRKAEASGLTEYGTLSLGELMDVFGMHYSPLKSRELLAKHYSITAQKTCIFSRIALSTSNLA